MPSYERAGSSVDQKEKSKLRRQSIVHSGYSFIGLELLGQKKRRVSAVDDLKRVVTETGIGFEIVSRQLMFEYNVDSGSFSAHVLDTDKNRDFLASHYDNRYWEIVSVKSGRRKTLDIDDVIADIIERRDKLAAIFAKRTKMPIVQPKPDVSLLSEEDLVKELEIRKSIAAAKSTISDMKPIETKTLTPAQRGAITRAKNRSKKKKFAAVTESKRPNEVVDSNNNEPVIDNGTTEIDSEFLKPVGAGVNQP